jgi:hypothetical protein
MLFIHAPSDNKLFTLRRAWAAWSPEVGFIEGFQED